MRRADGIKCWGKSEWPTDMKMNFLIGSGGDGDDNKSHGTRT